MRQLIRTFVFLSILLGFAASSFGGLTSISRRKTYTAGQIFTAADKNADSDHIVNAFNLVVPFFPGDSLKVPILSADTLVSNGISKLVSKQPIWSYDATDSLDYHRASFEHVAFDSAYAGGVPIAGFSFGLTAGSRSFLSYADTDTLNTDSLTVTNDAEFLGPVSVAGNFDVNFSAFTVLAGSGDVGVGGDLSLGDDVALTSGAIFDWASSDVTLTHSAGALAIAGDLGVGGTPAHDFYVYANDTSTEPMVYIEQEGTGDPAIGWMITGATTYMMGLDNDDSDYFKLAASNASLGTNTLWTVDTSGNTTIAGTLASGTVTVSSDLTLATGSITSASTAISFGDENLSTTGTLGAGATTVTGALTGSTHIGIGTTDIEAWQASFHAIEAFDTAIAFQDGGGSYRINNLYFDGAWKHKKAGYGSVIFQGNQTFDVWFADTAAENAAASWLTQTALVVNASGMNGTLGATTPAAATVTTLTANTTGSQLAANVGIGVAASTQTVKINSAETTNNGLFVEGTQTSGHTAYFYTNSTQTGNVLRVYQDGAGSTGPALYAYTDGSYAAAFMGGAVGIGTASPAAKLSISGATAEASLLTYAYSGRLANINSYYLTGDASYDNYLDISISGDDKKSHIRFLTQTSASTATTEKMRLDASGNLGIGTASPDGTLHVHTATAGTVTAASFADIAVFEGGESTGISILTPDANSGYIVFGSPTDNDYVQIGGAYNAGSPYLNFNVNGNSMRLDASGNLGLGVTPQGTGSGFTSMSLGGNGYLIADTAAGASKQLGSIQNGYWDGSNWTKISDDEASYYKQTAGTHEFYTAASGTGTITWGTAKLTISNDGALVSQSSTWDYGLKLYNLSNDARSAGILLWGGANDASGNTYYLDCYDGDGGQVGYIWNTSGTFQLVDASDRRIKDSIVDTDLDGIETIKKLKVRDFNKFGQPVKAGFVAQEVARVFPKAAAGDSTATRQVIKPSTTEPPRMVVTDRPEQIITPRSIELPDSSFSFRNDTTIVVRQDTTYEAVMDTTIEPVMMGVAYSAFVPLNVKAIQELIAQNEAQQAQIDLLLSEVASLKTRVTTLEKR